MKTTTALLLLMLCVNGVYSQVNEWTWVKGDSARSFIGRYNLQGVASAYNNPGGRGKSATWTDSATDVLWLFGGIGYVASGGGGLSDLWKYEVATNEWTWVKGDSTLQGQNIYGTQAIASPLNKPGDRLTNMNWIDASGNLWFFGGAKFQATGYNSDLWKYNPSSNEWTWMKGDTILNAPSSFGSKGIPSITNKPGARTSGFSWKDNSGNFWLFGGDIYGGGGISNDLWKFNNSTNNWTWINGDSVANTLPVYGIKGTGSSSNNPGARYLGVSWKDNYGNLWLFGGATYNGAANDVWKYDINTNEWTWMSGDSVPNVRGVMELKELLQLIINRGQE